MFLLDDLLVGAPLAAFRFVLRQLANVADRELHDDEDKVIGELRSLHARFEAGEIGQRAFRRAERLLLERWRVLKRRRMGL
jgi:hypothetical protein